MEPLSSKFANLNRPGIARQLVKGRRETEMPPAPQPEPFDIKQTVDVERQQVRITVTAKPKFDRTTYQRELMRTRRAADKEAKRRAKEKPE